ncbi:MAG: enoyl-CoA hydratase/isomerase family protein [Spirochaetales bacterium]|nr:enoyl-CoA hydratase/isomerase family protein [Leptospiraceae bacterium]MCP5480636.1 enoyl-CoA hydratase/isomerase family protein [Spirochaetales bacterium]MCP5483988.1 enoyl-CoA hydratase/isomerase family protein [Spirochaetales bacterium]
MSPYEFLKIERRDRLAWIWLNRAPLNTLTIEFMDEIDRAFAELGSDREVDVVLLGSKVPGFYCNGLDPDYLLERDVPARALVFERLFEMMRAMYAFEKPSAAVIDGHAMAGGAVLGVLNDFRFMSDGRYRFCFSEVLVGLTIPAALLDVIAGVTGRAALRDVAMLGTAYRAPEARAIHLIDEVFPAATLHEEAEARMRNLLPMAQPSLRQIKKEIRSPVVQRLAEFQKSTVRELEPFLSGNFEEGLRAVRDRRRPVFQNP